VPILEAKGLGRDYGDITAVKAVDLSVERGEIFGLLGPNGAGKTTTISMICGVVTPSRGSAVVDGNDIRKQPFPARRAMGLVPQDLALYEEITARQNLSFFGSIYGLSGKNLAERIDWVLDVAGLSDRAKEPVDRFSGGMKRRLNLAAGLLHKPKLLILDEPTVGVDPQSRNYIFDTIRALNSDEGMTVIYTSHYMEEVQSLCERVAIMDHGEVIALDTVDGLIAGHGGGSLEIELVSGDVDAAAAAIAELGDAETVEGKLRIVPNPGQHGAIVRAVEDSGATIKGLHTLNADLETVFLQLTGHTLRDS
jgi:ABC-2 type transport system ATP-binding protein